jgi:hypothetical protein
MGIEGLSTTSPITQTNYSAIAGSLTPDALLEYAQTQLSGIDSSINDLMNQQNAVAGATTALSSVANKLQENPDGFHIAGTSPDNPGANALPQTGTPASGDTPAVEGTDDINNDVLSGLNQALNDTTDPTNRASIQDLIKRWNDSYKDGNVSQAEMGQVLDQIKDVQSDVSTNQQVEMIQLQSLVSQRQQAIQMVSSMMQSINDSTKSVITNINQ